MQKPITLRTGMVVEVRSGSKYLVLRYETHGYRFLNQNGQTWCGALDVEVLEKELKMGTDSSLDIMKVYPVDPMGGFNSSFDLYCDPIWVRRETIRPSEMEEGKIYVKESTSIVPKEEYRIKTVIQYKNKNGFWEEAQLCMDCDADCFVEKC